MKGLLIILKMNIVTLSSHFTRSQIGIHDKNKISFVMQILSAFQMNPKRKKTQKWSPTWTATDINEDCKWFWNSNDHYLIFWRIPNWVIKQSIRRNKWFDIRSRLGYFSTEYRFLWNDSRCSLELSCVIKVSVFS